MRAWVRDHGLLLANAGLFALFFIGMVLSGVRAVGSELGGTYFATRVVMPGPYAQMQQQQ